MQLSDFIDSDLFTWLIVPLLILIARIFDVTLGTIRIMFVSRGHKFIAPLLGFFEILIWLLAIRQVLNNLSNFLCYIAYAGGFALGNLIGIYIDEKLAMGKRLIRIITRKNATPLVEALTLRGFGVTNIHAEGIRGKVSVLYTVVERSDIERVIQLIQKFNPKAFYTIEDVRSVKEGVFPQKEGFFKRIFNSPPKFYRRLKISRKLWFHRKGK